MLFTGESLSISATVEPVEVGELLTTQPLHMTLANPFSMEESDRPQLFYVMSDLFKDKSVFDNAVLGDWAVFGNRHPSVVRRVEGMQFVTMDVNGESVEVQPEWLALHAFIENVGKFNSKNRHSHTFSPHITNAHHLDLNQGDKINFESVALFGSTKWNEPKRVLESIALGDGND